MDDVSRETFRATLESIAPAERDRWIDGIFGLQELPEDSALPRGCVPYLPCPVDPLLRMIELAEVAADDVFVDIGCGLGRAMALVHRLTGAQAIGLEIQPALVRQSRDLLQRLGAEHVVVAEGDAVRNLEDVAHGSVFFLYCPFSGPRLNLVLDRLESIARTRVIRVCSVDLPLPPRPWLIPVSVADDLAVYRSRALR